MFKNFVQKSLTNFLYKTFTTTTPRVVRINKDETGRVITTFEEFKPQEKQKPIPKIARQIKMYGTESDKITIDDQEPKEEVEENKLNREIHYSDHCRIYVKAGDGGNGIHSMLKGHLFDQSM
jgi:hypothetical protein